MAENIFESTLFNCAVSKAAYLVVRLQNVSLLLPQQFRNSARQGFIQGIGIFFLGFVFAFFRGCQQSMVATAQLRFQIGPDAMNRPGRCAAFFYVMHSQAMKFVL